jgi:hypothetical protein
LTKKQIIEEIAQKGEKNIEKAQLHRATMDMYHATMRNYLFKENLRKFGKKFDPIMPRCKSVIYRATMEMHCATIVLKAQVQKLYK